MSRKDSNTLDILQSAARNMIYTTSGLYLLWHFTAILVWPRVFSPRLWVIGVLFMGLFFLVIRLLNGHYYLSQTIWLAGITGLIVLAYHLFQQPAVSLLIVFLPLTAILTIGPIGTLIVEILIIPLALFLYSGTLLPELPYGFTISILLGSLFTGLYGWGLSSNLLSALSSASYHYNEARRLLDETRQHRAQISLMLKDQHQANYQLDRLNQMLQWARTHAEEARAERDQFVLAVSHELRSPLNFIIGFSDLMVNSPETYGNPSEWPTGLYEDIQEIYRSSSHLMRLINDILDLGQIDAKQMALFRETVAFEQLLDEVRIMVEPAYRAKGLSLQVDCLPDIPPIFVDSTRIRQVLLNLLNNSLRFTDQGGVRIEVTVQSEQLQICVADTGSGIAQEDLPKVFNEFLQVDQDNWRRREGSGLGLAISKRFVQLHGGKMWLESTLGAGSRFFFTLPIQSTPADQESNLFTGLSDVHVKPLQAEPEISHQMVLLLSRQSEMLPAVQHILDEYQIVLIPDPESLVEQVQNTLPRAILVDGSTVDDIQTLSSALPYDLPVIRFIPPLAWRQSNILPEGAADYLVKPISLQDLIEAVLGLEQEIHSVLVVDDDPAMYRFITQVFKSPTLVELVNPNNIFSAGDGMQAIACLSKHTVDLLFLDIELPDIHGLELLAQIRQDPKHPDIQVIIISATDIPALSYYQGQRILDLALKQPFTDSEISSVLRHLISQIPPKYPRKISASVKNNEPLEAEELV